MANVRIGERELLNIIESVLMENKTFLKVGNGQGQTPPPPPAPPMDTVPPMDQGTPVQDFGMDDMSMPPENGGGENQFDTNFDAGVEADEESDPKTYIQQLTGKLSQSLNSFNNEQGPDPGLSKYVASMIVTAACKNLDDKAKKEIIEKINSAKGDAEDMPDNGELENSDNMGDGGDLQEMVFSKRQVSEMATGIGIRPGSDKENNDRTRKKETEPKKTKTIFKGKQI